MIEKMKILIDDIKLGISLFLKDIATIVISISLIVTAISVVAIILKFISLEKLKSILEILLVLALIFFHYYIRVKNSKEEEK